MIYLKADTAVRVLIGPAVAVGDGFTPVTTLTLSGADEAELIKYNGNTALAVTSISGNTISAITGADGYYDVSITAAQLDTEGFLVLVVNDDSLILPLRHEFMVVNANVYDALFAAAATDYLQVDTIQISGTAQTANDVGQDVNDILVDTGTTLQAELDGIQADTENIQTRLPAALVGGRMDSDIGADTGGIVPTAAANADAVWDEDIEAAHGTDATAGLLLRILGQNISNLSHDGNLNDRLDTIIAVIEHQRGAHTHQPIGNIFFVDPVNGDTHANGNRGGIADPYAGVQDCHDNAITDSNHDMIILLSGAAAGATTLTENVTLSKRYLFIRGPGRDFIWTRSGAGDTITITADGIELSGFQLNTAATGSGNGCTVTSADFFRAYGLWVLNTQGHGIQLTNVDNAVIRNNNFHNTGQSGAGHGLVLDAGNSQSGDNILVEGNHFHGVTGDCVRLNPTGTGTVNDAVITNNHFINATGDGVDLTGSGANRASIYNNVFGSISGSDINDSGTGTVAANNEQWAKQSVLGILTDAAAAGDPTSTDTGMAYIKQLINILIGTDGITTWPAAAVPADGVSLAEAIRSLASTSSFDTQITDSVPADGTLATREEALYMILQWLTEKAVSGTTATIKKVDGSTTLFTETLDDGTNPTSITRAT